MKTRKKLFVTDFDGTLLKDDKTISREDIRTLEILGQNNIVTAVATGRSVYSFEKAMTALGMGDGKTSLPVDYVIFSTGAGIMEYPGGRVMYQKAVTAPDIRRITACFDHRKFDYMVHRAIPDTRYFQYKSNGKYNPDFQARLALYKEYAIPLVEGARCTASATQVLAIIPGGAARGVIEHLQRELSGLSVIHATSPLDHQSSWIEVFHKDVSKSQAVAWLVKKIGIAQKDVVSVGNDYNDQDLLTWSGKGFVVGNAPDRLKTIFKTVSSNNDQGMTHAAKVSGLMDSDFF